MSIHRKAILRRPNKAYVQKRYVHSREAVAWAVSRGT
jgi:hypothetical protein